jgi:thiamine biosynthesis protein ThiI
MSENLFLVKYGEIALKKGNRGAFVKALRKSIKTRLGGEAASVYETWHRIYVRFDPGSRGKVSRALVHSFGVVSFSEALRTEKDPSAIDEAALTLGRAFQASGLGARFKLEVKRADKRFPLTSYQIACRLGDLLKKELPGLIVDVNNPDWVLRVEIRENAYLYGPQSPGPGGLPTGSSGKGLLLLSGGIDSPVAGYMMAKRGLALEAAYFHSAPFTSEKAREKVVGLSRILNEWAPRTPLHVVNFTPVLSRIREKARDEEITLLMRACMMRIANGLASRRGAGCLITGESLGQVASQTMESLHFTGGYSELPVFRPLIGLDKEEIIREARRIGTFETSNLPYADCCVLFSPTHPLIHPRLEAMRSAYDSLSIEELLQDAVENAERVDPLRED